MTLSPRAAAVMISRDCVEKGRSLSSLLPHFLDMLPMQQRALAQELSFGVLRWYYRLEGLLSKMLKKPLGGGKRDVHYILLVGLYQLHFLRKPAYAVVKETVSVAEELNQSWAKALINAILRRFLREQESLLTTLNDSWQTAYAYPDWLIGAFKADWKNTEVSIETILEAGNQRPPMTLRVNQRQQSVADYQQLLQTEHIQSRRLLPRNSTSNSSVWCEDALVLSQAQAVECLPGFLNGAVSVQDGAAQMAARLLNVQSGERVLDACAAPGGKTLHVLELEPRLMQLTALDISPERLNQVKENLRRGGFSVDTQTQKASMPEVRLFTADASKSDWWDGMQYDRILLDAPCSATGVIRRHPDIKVLRRASDITALVDLQQRILANLWGMLKPRGTMLYVTCSILRAENEQQIRTLLNTHEDAEEKVIQADWGKAMAHGRQIFPGELEMDGFYYAQVIKKS